MFPCISSLPNGAIIDPGEILYNTPGEDMFVCRNFNTCTVTVKGAGAGGNTEGIVNTITAQFVISADFPTLGDASVFNSIVVGGGGVYGGTGNRRIGSNPVRTVGANGANAAASGGDINTTGGGAVGGGGGQDDLGQLGGNGGNGGEAIKTYLPNELIVGESYQVVIGAGGQGGTVVDTIGYAHPQGFDGGNGSIRIEWT